MTNKEAIKILQGEREGLLKILDKSVPYEKQKTLVALDMAIQALKDERDCEHCSRTYGTLGCCSTVSNKWVYSCEEGHREYEERHKETENGNS